MRRKILGSLAILVVFVAAPVSIASAASLTRAECWVAKFDDNRKRSMCFVSSNRVTMTNFQHVVDSTSWSTCEFSGDYVRHGADLTVTFAEHSGKCSNGALSPEFTAVCTIADDSIACKGSSIVAGKTYEFVGTFY